MTRDEADSAEEIMGRVVATAEEHEVPVGLFVGAGASAALGIPTTSQFFRMALSGQRQEALTNSDIECDNSTAEGLIVNVVRAVKSRVGFDPDVEIVLDAVDRAVEHLSEQERLHDFSASAVTDAAWRTNWKPRGQSVAKEVGSAASNARTALQRLRSLHIDLTRRFYRVYGNVPIENLPMWQSLWEVLPVGEILPVFTTNYDRVFEELDLRGMMPNGMNLEDGFRADSRTQRFEWTPQRLVDDAPNRIVLHKLHGSVNWRHENGTLYSRGRKVCDDALPIEHSALVLPALRKLEPQGWVRTMYDLLRSWLQVIPCWVVIGFSFRDAYIRELFRESIVSGQTSRMIAIAPKPEAVGEHDTINQNLDELLNLEISDRFSGQRIFCPFGKEDCIDQLSTAVQTDADGSLQPPEPPVF